MTYFVSLKSSILSFFPNYAKVKVGSYDSLPIEQTMALLKIKVTSIILYS